MDFEWIHLPEPCWMRVFQQLDVKTLVKTSRVCTTFNNFLSNTILSEKLKLVLNLDNCKKDLNLIRNYRNVKLKSFSEHFPVSSEDFQAIIKLLKHVKKFQLEKCNISYNDWIYVIDTLKHVESICLNNVNINERSVRIFTTKTAVKIDCLAFSGVKNNPEMYIFDQIRVQRLKIADYNETSEQFLLNHEELQGLQAHTDGIFVNNKLANVKFSLQYLNLYFAYWTKVTKQNALNFIRTQTNLRRVILQIGVYQYDILFLKHIIENNPKLQKLSIKLDRDSEELLLKDIHQINSNPSVTKFSLATSSNKNAFLLENLVRIFPNNEAINDDSFSKKKISESFRYFYCRCQNCSSYPLEEINKVDKVYN